jgi:hypothetical protein
LQSFSIFKSVSVNRFEESTLRKSQVCVDSFDKKAVCPATVTVKGTG